MKSETGWALFIMLVNLVWVAIVLSSRIDKPQAEIEALQRATGITTVNSSPKSVDGHVFYQVGERPDRNVYRGTLYVSESEMNKSCPANMDCVVAPDLTKGQ